jgi:hypothetical protein
MHYKVVALDESYNFHITFISGRVRTKEIWFFKYMVSWDEKIMLVIWASKRFQIKKNLNYKVVDLDESYNFNIKFISIQVHTKITIFWRVAPPTAAWNGGMDCYSTVAGSSTLPLFRMAA